MSVRPIAFNNSTQIYTMLDEAGGHQFDILLSELNYTVGMDGNPSHNFMVIQCLVCPNTSTWPVGGGADAINGQQMFVNKITQAGCACGNVESGNDVLADAHAHLNCARMDGAERWQI